ncbi:MAG: transketolase family protein [Clostridiales bacterium]|jgi:transketolase|nr:transketolase family protein [Clostridiales bacterium]
MMESKKVATRAGYGAALAELGGDERIIVLDADLSKSTNTAKFAEKYPERFINCGIAEANMMSVAAGLAVSGKIVFASTFAMFAAGRAYEQVRNSVCYPNLNVKIGATHAGISVGEDGATHQPIEDLALMRVIPNMTVVCPADAIEAQGAVRAAIETPGPFYLRLGRLPVPQVNPDGYEFRLGKGVELRTGSDVSIIATGLMVSEALRAADILAETNISARVINIHTIKPIDRDIILKAARETRGIVTAEEHSIIGGLGGAVAEVTARDCPVRIAMTGMEDTFGRSGKPADLLKYYGLTAERIVEKCTSIL